MLEIFNLANYGQNAHGERLLLSSIALLILGIYILLQNRRSLSNISFASVCFCIFIWLFSFSIMSFLKKEELMVFWFKFGEAGVCFVPSSVYLFFISFIGRFQEKKNWVFSAYLVSLAFVILLLTTNQFVSGVYKYYWGYYDLFGPIGSLFLVFFAITMLMALLTLYEGYKSAKTKYAKKIVQITFISSGLAYLAAFDFVAHYKIALYPFGYIFIVIFLTFVARSIVKYKYLTITPALAAENILETIFNSLILIDAEGKILTVNKATCDLLGYKGEELAGKQSMMIGPFQEMLKKEGQLRSYEMDYRAKSGEMVPVLFSGNILRDYQDEIAGMICFSGQEIAGRKGEGIAGIQ
ncbi:MAG: PAS domain S-box protein [Candidatus Saganbacteria bacterium]|nr:PAS domain S-box protein [Candidatus Saganbacteria bacterium]